MWILKETQKLLEHLSEEDKLKYYVSVELPNSIADIRLVGPIYPVPRIAFTGPKGGVYAPVRVELDFDYSTDLEHVFNPMVRYLDGSGEPRRVHIEEWFKMLAKNASRLSLMEIEK